MALPVVHIRVKAAIHGMWIALLVGAAYVPGFASAQSLCKSCELQLGLGGTYHFWGRTGGVVLPLSVTWSDRRYEFAVFRISTQQTLYDANYRNQRLMAQPYWGLSISRRWRLLERGRVVAELTVRHWSNGGLRLPNHGQDFATLTVRLNSGRFGVDRAEQIAPDELGNSRAALIAANNGIEGLP